MPAAPLCTSNDASATPLCTACCTALQRLYNTTLLLEDLDTFAADVAAKHVDLSDKKLVGGREHLGP